MWIVGSLLMSQNNIKSMLNKKVLGVQRKFKQLFLYREIINVLLFYIILLSTISLYPTFKIFY